MSFLEKAKQAVAQASTQAKTIYEQQSERYKAQHGEGDSAHDGAPAASLQGSPSSPGRASTFNVNSIRVCPLFAWIRVKALTVIM